MVDHRKRFDTWRKRLPTNTKYLVDQVLMRIVPEFESRGFVWHPDYGGGDVTQIGANEIPLQIRKGEFWPTVQIAFNNGLRPNFHLNFAVLPPICTRWKNDAYVDIQRENALVFEGPAYFALCKGRDSCQYGYHWFSLFPRRYLDSEVEILLRLLPELFDLFDRGIPKEWSRRKFGHVTEHVLLIESR